MKFLKELWLRIQYVWSGKINLPAPEPCKSCQLLEEQLAYANYDRKILLENILKFAFPDKPLVEDIDTSGLLPLTTGKRSFMNIRREREAKSRQIASSRAREVQDDVNRLEKELGIQHGETRQAVSEN